jgi:uncharacterized GH25 family protein
VPIIRGHVVDPQGHPVAEAAVYVVSAPVSMPDIAQLTDEKGQFTMSVPKVGRYTLGFRSEAWGSTQTDIEVSSEEPVAIEVQFKQPAGE